MTTTPDVRPDQIWAPKPADSSDYRRRIRIDRVGKAPGWSYDAATCHSWWEHRPYPAANWRISTTVRKTVIRLDRFATDYRLVQDAPDAEPEGCDELLDQVERALSDAEPEHEQECGYSYDHDARNDDTECRRCGADLSAWASDEPTATEGETR